MRRRKIGHVIWGDGNQATHKREERWTFHKGEEGKALHGEKGKQQFVGEGEWAVLFGLGHWMVMVQGRRAIGPFPPGGGTFMEPIPSGWHTRGSVSVRKSCSKASKKLACDLKKDTADRSKRRITCLPDISMS